MHLRVPLLNPTKAYLILASVFGILFVFFMPGGHASPDEHLHFFRAYQISKGDFLADFKDGSGGGLLPASLGNFVERMPDGKVGVKVEDNVGAYLKQPLEEKNLKWFAFPNTSVYSPINYIPAVIGIQIGKIFNSPPIILFYLARIFTLACWIAVTTFLLSKMPYGKLTAATILLIPSMLFFSATIAPEATVNLLAFAVAVLSIIFIQRGKISSFYIAPIALITAMLALVKPGYLLLALPFLAFYKKFKNPAPLFIAFTLSFLIFGAWNVIHRGSDVSMGVHVPDPKEQIKGLVKEPLKLGVILVNTYATTASDRVAQGVSVTANVTSPAQQLGIHSPLWLFAFMFLTLFLAFYWSLPAEDVKAPPRAYKLLALLSIFGTWVGISLMLYIFFSPPGSMVIYGIQGRYFLPLLLAAIPFAYTKTSWVNKPAMETRALLLMVASFIGLIAFFNLIYAFYYLQIKLV